MDDGKTPASPMTSSKANPRPAPTDAELSRMAREAVHQAPDPISTGTSSGWVWWTRRCAGPTERAGAAWPRARRRASSDPRGGRDGDTRTPGSPPATDRSRHPDSRHRAGRPRCRRGRTAHPLTRLSPAPRSLLEPADRVAVDERFRLPFASTIRARPVLVDPARQQSRGSTEWTRPGTPPTPSASRSIRRGGPPSLRVSCTSRPFWASIPAVLLLAPLL